jgi:hypothetical protein
MDDWSSARKTSMGIEKVFHSGNHPKVRHKTHPRYQPVPQKALLHPTYRRCFVPFVTAYHIGEITTSTSAIARISVSVGGYVGEFGPDEWI